MTTQIRRTDYPDYASYLDAICEPIGGAMNPAIWDEDEQEWMLDDKAGREAMQRVTALGCDFKTSVSKNLTYLVIGDGDFVQFADGWRTGKLQKALSLREAGGTIEIIPEKDFLHLLLS